MREYWLNKLFYDVQRPPLRDEYRTDRERVLERYPLKPETRAALLAEDFAYLAPRVNPYLLRFYFQATGMPDEEFIRRLRALAPAGARHG